MHAKILLAVLALLDFCLKLLLKLLARAAAAA